MTTSILERMPSSPVTRWPEAGTLQETEQSRGEKMRAEFEKLWTLYTGRRAGLSFDIGSTRIDDEAIATRYFHEHDIEEVYWRTRIYGVQGEQKNSFEEVIFVHVFSDEGEQELHVDAEGAVGVRVRPDNSAPWTDADPQTAESISFEFFTRTMIAAERHAAREPGDKITADAQALAMLRARYPMFATPMTSWD